VSIGINSSLAGRFSFRDTPGWLISVGVHVAMMLLLLGVRFHTAIQKEETIMGSLEEVQADNPFDQALTERDQIGVGDDVATLTNGVPGSTAVTAATSEFAATAAVQRNVDEGFKEPAVSVSIGDPVGLAISDSLGSAGAEILTGGSGTENVAGAGGGGVEGAIDRLAWEIAQSLHQKKTTVIWLFDQSLSLRDRRDAIADRFENVYRQLDAFAEADKDTEKGALLSVVATYGEKFNLLNDKPIEDIRTMIPKVRAIPNDESGKENVFFAVNMLATKFKSERTKGGGRNVMIFIVTDEKGDDAEKYLEESILLCRRYGIKVYCVGNAALFGREKGYVTWVYPDESKEELEVDAGPETVEPEALALGFWGSRGPDLTRMSSSYGPYGLTRLCKETGGLYFIAQEDEKGLKFDPAVMRNYQPDYRPIRDYMTSLSKNKAKAALVTAAKATKVENIPLPNLSFRAYNDNILREEVTESQKPVAELIYKINQLVEILGQGEKDRDRVTEPRWRAAYDLAIGRALAMRVRLEGYNLLLAEMKSSIKPFTKKDSNEWKLVPSKNITAGATIKKLERQASTYLKRVMDEHPGTPWEKLAERELSMAMGWEWVEANNPQYFPANTSQGEAQRRILLAEEERKKKQKSMPPAPQKAKPKL
jgi:hypothetical protein